MQYMLSSRWLYGFLRRNAPVDDFRPSGHLIT